MEPQSMNLSLLLLNPVLVRYTASFALHVAPKGPHVLLQGYTGVRSPRTFSTGASGAAEVSSGKHYHDPVQSV